MSRWVLPLLIYGALACMFGLVGLRLFGEPRALDLFERAVVTEGSVTEPTCENHNTVVYSFRANGRLYQANDQPLDDNCERVRANDYVRVWYIPDAPQASSLQDPGDVLENDIITAAIGAIILPAPIMWRIIWRAVKPGKSGGAGSRRGLLRLLRDN